MFIKSVVFCASLLSLGYSIDLAFPEGFKFGAATASYQIEGGWNSSDKSESIWDVFTHTKPEAIQDHSNGDVACDSYNLWQRDIQIAVELGLDFYRFSLSWTRLLPSGYGNKISENGVKYYNNLINGLLEQGIEPVVTIFHWDLPQPLQDLGGWLNPFISELFADYARIVYALFGDRVKTWITINEILSICDGGHGTGMLAPGISRPEFLPYICVKNSLIAHAKAWRIYDEEFRSKFNGKVSNTNVLIWLEPADEDDEELVKLTELGRQLSVGLYSHAIYSKEGGWPLLLQKTIAEYSRQQGFRRSTLPDFTEEEIELVRGTFDFFGMNHYSSNIISKLEDGDTVIWPDSGSPSLGFKLGKRPEWAQAAAEWQYEYPEGIRHLLRYLNKEYGNIPILITENGYSTKGYEIEDRNRINYMDKCLKQVLLSIKEDGIKVIGYTAWSLMDNFEWNSGYIIKFGLYEVNYTSPNLSRTPRASAKFYADIIKHRSLRSSIKQNCDELYY